MVVGIREQPKRCLKLGGDRRGVGCEGGGVECSLATSRGGRSYGCEQGVSARECNRRYSGMCSASRFQWGCRLGKFKRT